MSSKVAVVTGGSRGLGKGIVRALCGRGFTVYSTSRSEQSVDAVGPETEGRVIPVICDHAEDDQVGALFERIKSEHGRLDILVNNAAQFNAADLARPGGFWEKPLAMADMISVGLRSSYVAAFHATPLMISTGSALIANISFYGAVSYHHAAAYGAAKAGTDKMTFDMGWELRSTDVAAISLWPGLILTDEIRALPQDILPAPMIQDLPNWETPDFTGLVIERLWRDPDRMKLSGETMTVADLGLRYRLTDLDGKQPRVLTATLGEPAGRFLIPGATEE